MTEQKTNLVELAHKKKHLYLIEKMHKGKPLTGQEMKELQAYEQPKADDALMHAVAGGFQKSLPGVPSPKEGYVPISVLARLIDVSERTIQDLAQDSDIPQSINGQYHLVNSVHGYIRKLRASAAGRGKDPTRSEAELRKIIAEAKMAELDLQKKEGELLDASEVKRSAIADGQRIRSALNNIITRTKAHLAAETSPKKIDDILQAEFQKITEEVQAKDVS